MRLNKRIVAFARRSPSLISLLLLIVILWMAWGIRSVGRADWDGYGGLIHPDETHMGDNVTTNIIVPDSFRSYLRTECPVVLNEQGEPTIFNARNPQDIFKDQRPSAHSGCNSLNPRSLPSAADHVYGSWPSTIVRFVAEKVYANATTSRDQISRNQIVVMGRIFSSLADLGTIILLYLIGKRLANRKVGLLAILLFAFMPAMIQHAHFYVVDSQAAFYGILTLYFCLRLTNGGIGSAIGAGIALAMAISSKINMAPLALIVILAAMQNVWTQEQFAEDELSPSNLFWRLWLAFWRGFPLMFVAGLTTLIGIRFFMPDIFRGTTFFDLRLDPRFIRSLGTAQGLSSGEWDLPPSHQWTGRTNIVHELRNLLMWGMGVPVGITAWLAWAALGVGFLRRHTRKLISQWWILWAWTTFYFFWQASRPIKPMRYLLPLYGVWALMAAWGLIKFIAWARRAEKPRLFRRLPLLYTAYGWSIAVVLVTMLWGWGFSRIYSRTHTRIQAANWARANIPPGSAVSSDTWDIGIPRLDGGIWPGFQIPITAEDGVDKLEEMLKVLDHVDYLAFTSNRAYGSLPQLPMRFPMSINYFNAVFDGSLGFEKVADFTSYPSFLGIPIPDDYATEDWSVYDHPRVTIWHKTSRWNINQARAILSNNVNLNEIYKLRPVLATPMPTMLQMTVQQWQNQAQSGSWTSVFAGIANKFSLLAWLIAIEILGIAAFGLLWRWRLPLPDRGLGMARIVGLLLLGFGAWLPPALHLWSFSRLWIVIVYGVILAAGAHVLWHERRQIRAWLTERRHTVLTSQIIYFAFFVVLLTIRWLNPDLWHPGMGGEKPMNLAYLTATLKSQQFPPYDPWFAGGYLNYYYWGYVLVGTPMKLLGINPEYGFNLALPLLYGITAQLAGSIAYNAFSPLRRSTWAIEKRAIRLAIAASVALVLLGNLVQVVLYFNGARILGNPTLSFANTPQNQNFWLNGGSPLTDAVNGMRERLAGKPFPFRPEWPYWNATRVIPNGPINEFPFFSYLYGDLHAHVIALPLTVLLLLLILTLWRARRKSWLMLASLGAAMGFVVGALRATNIWDYPTFLALGLVASVAIAWRRSAGIAWRRRWWLLPIVPLAMFVVMKIAWQPFNSYFATGTSDTIGFLGEDKRMSVRDFIVLYGIWLWVVIPFLLRITARIWSFLGNVLVWGGTIIWYLALIGWSYRLQTRPVTPDDNKLVQFISALIWKPIEQQAASILLIVPLLAIAVSLLIIALRHPQKFRASAHQRQFVWQQKASKVARILPRELLPLAFITAALGLLLLTETIVLPSAGRMNIVFKFGYQAWTLLAIASTLALPSLWSSGQQKSLFLPLRQVWRVILVGLIAAGLFYPLTATQAKVNDRYVATTPHGLDGMAWMQGATWNENAQIQISTDADAIRWMRANIQGTPTILEASTSPYRWNSRIAIWTGLPTLIGWDGHENQQRAPTQISGIIGWRKNVIQRIYTAFDVNTVAELLDQYGVGVIYIGQLERAIYGSDAGLRVFEQLGDDWRKAYDTPEVQIFVRQTPAPAPDALPPVRLPGIPDANPVANVTLPVSSYLTDAKVAKNLPIVAGFNDWAWLSQHQIVAVVLWLLFFEMLGLLAFPLAALALRSHIGAAWGLSKILGLVLLGWLVWMPASLGLIAWDRRAIVLGISVLAIFGVLAWMYGARRRIMHTFRPQLRSIIITEFVFIGLFVVWTLIRAANPDLWHPFWGGEKPFEFGFLNAIIRSPQMPPVDPFYNGGTINYYYYGLYLMALPIKLLGLDPAIGFNLAVAIVGALVGLGAWSVGLLITRKLRVALLSLIMVAVIGNLASGIPAGSSSGIAGIIRAYQACDVPTDQPRPGCDPLTANLSFGAMLKDAGTYGTLNGFDQRLGSGVPWFWGPSRVLVTSKLNTINEFPFWSMIFADLHPHLIVLPLTLLLIGLAWELSRRRSWCKTWPTLATLPFVLGAFGAANAWDVPTYAILLILACFARGWQMRRSAERTMQLIDGRRDPLWRPVLTWLGAGIGLVALAMALYAPFFGAFHAPIGGIWPVRIGSPIIQWLLIYGLFVLIIIGWLLLPTRQVASRWRVASRFKWWLGVLVLGILAGGWFLFNRTPIAMQSVFSASLPIKIGLIALIVVLVRRWFSPQLSPVTRWAVLLAVLGASVAFGVEWVFIRDHLAPLAWTDAPNDSERMNTVFKFGFQVWVLWALVSAILLPRLLGRLKRNRFAYSIWLTLISVLFGVSLIFPIFGTISRINTRFAPLKTLTLDGLAYMQDARYSTKLGEISLADDVQAIRWINSNIKGTPTLIQSEEEFYRTFGIRIAANTGLPTIVSALHSNEQRPPELVAQRISDVQEIYQSADPAKTQWLLNKYRVDYVYLGTLERLRTPNAEAKFNSLAGLERVYQQGSVTIYRTTPEIANLALSWRPNAPTGGDIPIPPPQGGNEVEQAVAAYENDPNNVGKAFEAGRQLWQAGQPDRAAAILSRSADLNPNDVALHHLLGDVLLSAKRYDEAVKAYQQAYNASPTPGNQIKLGTGYVAWAEIEPKQLTEAERQFKDAIAVDPDAVDAYYWLGETYRLLGLVDDAKLQYQEYLNRAPTDGMWVDSAKERMK